MPVTHGVRGSSPLRTAKKDNRKVVLFFVFVRMWFFAGMCGKVALLVIVCQPSDAFDQ